MSANAFDPENPSHVEWFRKSLYTDSADPKSIISQFNSNPFGIKLDSENFMDLPIIHSMIALKFSRAVFERKINFDSLKL